MTTTDSHRRPNKPWRDVTDWDNGYDTAVKEYEPMLRECEATEDALTKILQDLIAELRGYSHRARNDMADHYEQRLNEALDE